MKEETGLDVRNAEGGYAFTYKRVNPDEGDNYFVDVYRFVMDIDEKDVSFQEAEIDGHMFATREQIESFFTMTVSNRYFLLTENLCGESSI